MRVVILTEENLVMYEEWGLWIVVYCESEFGESVRCHTPLVYDAITTHKQYSLATCTN